MIYSRVIVDECGEIMEYISDLTGAEINEILDEHPEWQIKCVPIGGENKIEFKKAIEIINEIVETCRSCSFCRYCPYWDKKIGDCKVHMTAKVENTPDQW